MEIILLPVYNQNSLTPLPAIIIANHQAGKCNKAGLYVRVTLEKPLLRRQNKRKRLNWSREHQHWTLEQWNCMVLWIDESKFEIFGLKRHVFVWRSAGESASDQYIVPTIKHGSCSVMIWRCSFSTVEGDIIKIEGILKKEQYRSILENNAIPSGLRLLGQNFLFEQDNYPKHSSKLCKYYLRHLEAEGKWPPQSTDLNPIKLLWEELDRDV